MVVDTDHASEERHGARAGSLFCGCSDLRGVVLALDLYLPWHILAIKPKSFSPVRNNLPMLPANPHLSRIPSPKATKGLMRDALASGGLWGLVAFSVR